MSHAANRAENTVTPVAPAEPITRVLFVCLGNICRSPTAEAVFRQRVSQAGWDALLQADSAGTAAWHCGKPPDLRSQRHGAERGYDLVPLRARQVSWRDFDSFDHILALDGKNLDDLQALQRQAVHHLGHQPRAVLAKLMDYAPELPNDVPDPYTGGPEGFDEVIELIETAIDGLLRSLLKARGVFGCAC
ncbi:MAG: low molecular weight protein-tyrosine-phosphatase [Paraperlucidibaca sp.]